MEVETPTHEQNREFADVDINNGSASGASDEEEVPAPGSVTLEQDNDLFVSAMTPSEVHVSFQQHHKTIETLIKLSLISTAQMGRRLLSLSSYVFFVTVALFDLTTSQTITASAPRSIYYTL